MSFLDILRRPPVLAQRLREIVDAASAPEEGFEPSLHAIVEFSGAAAGALCLFDPRRSLLRLASESGLSDEGCRRLRTVRWADPTSWDIPLHGLMNRRAYLIENPMRNRYVPRLIDGGLPVQTVACVPVYSGPDPLASLILVTIPPRTFGERDIHLLARALPELARLILAARRQAGGTLPLEPPQPQLPIELVTLSAERDRLLGELAERDAATERLLGELAERLRDKEELQAVAETAERARVALETELADARGELDRLQQVAASAIAAERERQDLRQTLAERVTREGELGRRLGELEHAHTEAARLAGQHAAELSRRDAAYRAELGRLETRLHDADAVATRERRMREEHDAAAGAQRATVAEELRATQETLRQEQESRTAAQAEAAALRGELEAARRAIDDFEHVAVRAGSDIERLEAAEHANRVEREGLAQTLEQARADEAAARAQAAALESKLQHLYAERDGTYGWVAETGSLRAQLADVSSERDRLQITLAQIESERDRLRAELEGAGATQQRIEAAFEREAAERAQSTSALSETVAALEALKAAHGRAEAEAAEHAAEIARLLAERDRAVAARDAAGAPERRPAAPAAPPAPAPAPVRLAVTSAPRTAKVRELEAGRKAVVVVDGDGTWERVLIPGHQVVVVAPDDEAAARITALNPVRVIVNLASRDVLPTMLGVRELSPTTRIWGCIADPAANRALSLAMLEPSIHPLDPDGVVEVVRSYLGRGDRVVTAGADVDALMSLRQALSRLGISVSMAWDGKQAVDLLGVVKPQVVVIDLDLPKREGYAITAGLGRIGATPHAVLLGGGAETATAFAATLADPDSLSRSVPLETLLTDVLARTESTPIAERRTKVRALPVGSR